VTHQQKTFSFHNDLLAEKPAVNTISGLIIQALSNYVQNGHVCFSENDLIDLLNAKYFYPVDLIKKNIEKLAKSNEIIIETFEKENKKERIIYLPAFYFSEKNFSIRLQAFLTIPTHIKPHKIDRLLPEIELKMNIELSKEQQWILQQILRYKTAIITGCPGTGKTTLTRSICLLLQELNQNIALAAPTGRAAQRLGELTHFKAQTIHRLLGYNPDKNIFFRNELNPLDIDAIIIDEISMVDIFLIYHLLKAIPMNAVLILVGDRFQLPSVGPGNVLKDLINSERIPVFSLSTVFRHGENSNLAQNATLINQGDKPKSTKMKLQLYQSSLNSKAELKLIHIKPLESSDPHFIFIKESQVEMILKGILFLCRKWIPQNFGFHAIEDIQVITPMHKGSLGTRHLNYSLQKYLNKSSSSIIVHGNKFQLGDKVMHLKNNYEKEVYNGDIGRIQEINPLKKVCVVNYQEKMVSYTIEELKELSLSYAITVHKSQGAEYPAIIFPIVTQHYIMLQRNLLYTAITRGKKIVCVIGTDKAMDIALKNNQQEKRFTLLTERLKGQVGKAFPNYSPIDCV